MKHFYIATSKVSGLGIMAGEDIKKGEIIRQITGKVQFLSVKNKEDSLSYPNWIGIGKGKWIDPDHPHQYLNHSCDPTAGINDNLELVALKDIKEGQEITIDYAIIEGDDLWEMPCSCGAKECRGTIRSVKYLPKSAFERYLPYIPSYFKNLYLDEHNMKRSGRGSVKILVLGITLILITAAVCYYRYVQLEDFYVETNPDGPVLEE